MVTLHLQTVLVLVVMMMMTVVSQLELNWRLNLKGDRQTGRLNSLSRWPASLFHLAPHLGPVHPRSVKGHCHKVILTVRTQILFD